MDRTTILIGYASCGIAAGAKAGGHSGYPSAQKAMSGLKPTVYRPDVKAQAVYARLSRLYKQLHDAFGTTAWQGHLHPATVAQLHLDPAIRPDAVAARS